MKKILSVFLVVLFVLPVTLVPVKAVTIQTYGNFEYYENEDGVTLYKCNTTAPKGTAIPRTLGGKTVTEIGPNAFSGNKNLTEITVPDTVKRIGGWAFQNCAALQKITIPDTVVELGNSVFSGSAALTEIVLPDTITEIPNRSFYDCKALTTVNIPQSVTAIGEYAFYNCAGLSSINIPQGVTAFGLYAFYKCSALTAVNITDTDAWCQIEFKNTYANPLYYAKNLYLNGSLLTNLEVSRNVEEIKAYVFYNCTSLKSVSIDNLYLTSIGTQAFYSCSGLTEFNITDLTEWCKTEFNGAYANPSTYAKSIKINKKHLTELTIPNWIRTVPDYAFYGADIETLNIPKTVKKIGVSSFGNCSSLSDINFEDSLKIINANAFYGCSSLTQVDLPQELDVLGDYAFSNCSNLVTVNGGSKITKVGEYAFNKCESLKSFTAPETLESIEKNAFNGCTSLENVLLSSNVKTISYGAFRNCENLKSISNLNGVEKIEGYAFENCDALASVDDMPALKQIDEYAFSYCTSLKEINLFEGLETINGCAFSNSALENLVLPDSLEKIGALAFNNTPYFDDLESNANGIVYNGKHVLYVYSGMSGAVTVKDGTKTIAYQAFANCTSITKITLPQTLESIGGYAFYNCKNLTQLNIPTSVEYLGAGILNYSGIYNTASYWTGDILYVSNRLICAKTSLSGEITIKSGTLSIAEQAFKNCTSLSGITVSSGIKVLPESVFEGCSGLTYVNLPNSLEKIERNAFKGFSIYKLDSICIPKSVKYLDKEYMGVVNYREYKPTVICNINSAAEKHALENDYPIQLIDTVANIYINTLPNKSEYNVGEVLDTEGLTLTVLLSDYSEEIVSSNFTVGECDMSTVGEKTVTVSYNGFNTLFRITVKEPKYPESQHNYENNTDKTWVYTSPINCTALKVTFSEDTVLENHWDWVYIYDSLGNIIREYTGEELAGKTIQVNGNVMRIGLVTDDDYTKKGFEIVNIRPVNPETAYGDLDENGIVNAKDMISLKKLILKCESFTQNAEILSDMNLDGRTDILDLIKIKKSIADS